MSNLSNQLEFMKEYSKDQILMDRSTKLTEMFLGKFEIDTITKLVKDYQNKYIAIKKIDPKLAKIFTIERWGKDIVKRDEVN